MCLWSLEFPLYLEIRERLENGFSLFSVKKGSEFDKKMGQIREKIIEFDESKS